MLKLWGHGLTLSSLKVPPTNTRWNTKLDFALFGWINSTISVKLTKPWKLETFMECYIAGFSIRAGGHEIRRLFHVNVPSTFLWKLPQFFFWEIVNAETKFVRITWTTCKIRHHVFTSFDARTRNIKCKNKNVLEVLK